MDDDDLPYDSTPELIVEKLRHEGRLPSPKTLREAGKLWELALEWLIERGMESNEENFELALDAATEILKSRGEWIEPQQ